MFFVLAGSSQLPPSSRYSRFIADFVPQHPINVHKSPKKSKLGIKMAIFPETSNELGFGCFITNVCLMLGYATHHLVWINSRWCLSYGQIREFLTIFLSPPPPLGGVPGHFFDQKSFLKRVARGIQKNTWDLPTPLCTRDMATQSFNFL